MSQPFLFQAPGPGPRPSLERGGAPYFGSVMRRTSLQSRPMKVADSSTEGNLGMGMWVDWYTLCQSWICKQIGGG